MPSPVSRLTDRGSNWDSDSLSEVCRAEPDFSNLGVPLPPRLARGERTLPQPASAGPVA